MHIFIITSTLNPKIGVLSPEVRYEQTLNTIKSIRERANGSLILLVDSSPQPIEDAYISDIKSKVDHYITLSNHTHAIELGNAGLKSPAECYVMVIALDVIRNLSLTGVNRVFKITGRGELTERFNIEDYDNPDMVNKFVFKTSVNSWMAKQLKLIDTRLWSFDYTLFEEANKLVRDSYSDCMATNWDLEHTYYKLLDKTKLFEKDIIGLKCQLASTGEFIDE